MTMTIAAEMTNSVDVGNPPALGSGDGDADGVAVGACVVGATVGVGAAVGFDGTASEDTPTAVAAEEGP